MCIVSEARLLDAKTPNLDEVSGTLETTAGEKETADRLIVFPSFFFCFNPIRKNVFSIKLEVPTFLNVDILTCKSNQVQ